MANQLQEQVSTVWKKTPPVQRITLIALILAAVVIVAALIGWAQRPSYSVAYSGLSDADAGKIVSALDAAGISYQLKGGGTILVPADKVYDTRLSMASQGLPESSTVGYELFSGNTLGMTEFTQKVNYQRALEGELERTIGSLDAVESVRVHVVTPEKALLSSDQSPTTASVIIKEKTGASMNASQVKSITHLVAYSVEGLKPENVVVVDANGNLLSSGSANGAETLITQSDDQRAAEIAAANEIRNKVQTMLDTILGPDRSAVQASVVMDWSQKEITSNVYDPTQVAVRSSQKETEGYTGTGGTTGGVPGAASNLPTPVATTAATSTSGNYSHTIETTNYEVSQTQTHEIYAPGQIKNISLAVMVDKVTDEKQLEMIKSAVTTAAGIDTSRGDAVSVNTMEFDRTYYQEQSDAMAKDAKNDLYMKIGTGVGAGLALILLFAYFSKVMKNLRMSSKSAWKPILIPAGSVAMQPGLGSGTARYAASEGGQVQGSSNDAAKKAENDQAISHVATAPKSFPEDEQRARVISRLTEESPATVAEIIQIWLSEDEKKNG